MGLRHLLPLLVGGIAACGAASSTPEAPPQDAGCILIGPRVSPGTVTLLTGDNVLLTVIPSPCDHTTPVVAHWRSGNSAIVSVDSSGMIHGVSAGQTAVTVWVNADSTVKGAAVVLVNAR